jgi:hypothetical protein
VLTISAGFGSGLQSTKKLWRERSKWATGECTSVSLDLTANPIRRLEGRQIDLIPSPADQDRYAQSRRPMDMMVHG